MKDGAPLASQYRYDPNDPEQKFKVYSGNHGQMIEIQGRCLNGHNPTVGSTLNLYKCDPNDPEMGFNIQGDTILQGDLKVDIGSGNDRKVVFVPASQTTTTQPKSPSAQPSQKTVVKQYNEYEFWMLVDNKIDIWKKYPGHSLNAIVTRSVSKFSDGSSSSTQWNIYKTFSMNPNPGTYVNVDTDTDHQLVKQYLSQHTSHANIAARKMNISERVAHDIESNYHSYAGCATYSIKNSGSACSCIDYATRMWYVVTNNREDQRPQYLFFNTPQELYYWIKDYNNSNGEFFMGGRKVDTLPILDENRMKNLG